MEGSFSGIAFSSRVLVWVVAMFKSNPRNSVFSWKVAFRGLLFQVVIVVVVCLPAVVVLAVVVLMLKCNPRNSIFSWKVAFRG